MAQDTGGNVYLTGFTHSFVPRAFDVFIVKLNPSGSVLWQRTWGGPYDDFAYLVATDSSSNVYVIGQTNIVSTNRSANYTPPQLFLIKFNSTGQLQWQKTWGGTMDRFPSAITVDKDQNIIASAAYISSISNTGQVNGGLIVAKFNPSGGIIWSSLWRPLGSYPTKIVTDAAGSIYVSTSYAQLLKLTTAGVLLWQTQWGNSVIPWFASVAVDSVGNSYLTGGENVNYNLSLTYNVALILKINPSGQLVWQRTWGRQYDFTNGHDLEVDSTGKIYLTGEIVDGGVSAFLLKLSTTGDILWQRTWTSSIGYGIAMTSTVNVEVAGMVYSAPPYTQGFSNSTLGKSIGSLSNATGISNSTIPSVISASGTVMIPSGSTSYAGKEDAALFTLNNPSESVPAPPTNPQASGAPNHVSLTWQIPPSDGGSAITGYNIYRSIQPGYEILLASVGLQNTYTDNAIQGGAAYFYKITALNALGESAYSSETNATPTSPPNPPTNFTATLDNGRIILRWSLPTSDGGLPLTAYNIYKGTVPGAETFLYTMRISTQNRTVLFPPGYYTDTAITAGVTYYYRVTAANSLGESRFTSEIAVPVPTILIPLLILAIVSVLVAYSYFRVRAHQREKADAYNPTRSLS